MKRDDIIGQKFGRLTVIKIDHLKPRYNKTGGLKGHRIYYLCQCDCGNTHIAGRDGLLRGSIKSCGCYKKEFAKQSFSKHNLTNHRLYNTWCHMKRRCYNPTDKAYKNYGERGICMCQEWKDNFENFYNWAISNGYKENLTLDRIDINGNYEPSNCRFATLKEQQNNKQNHFYITIYNRTQTLSEWCEEKNLNYGKILARIQSGWTIEDAFTK
nr:MAG TPA: PVL ORF-50-like family [Caudoviricetes sp.]